jgi:hypothetical protein
MLQHQTVSRAEFPVLKYGKWAELFDVAEKMAVEQVEKFTFSDLAELKLSRQSFYAWKKPAGMKFTTRTKESSLYILRLS